MNKNERACLLRKLKPLTWYYFCQMEALNPEEALITQKDLQEQLMIGSAKTLKNYLDIWESHRMIRQVKGGFIISQLDGALSGISEDPIVREFKNAKELINYWCDLYEDHYGQSYMVNNWGMASTQVNKLLRYPDEEIKATLQAIISLYDTTWTKPAYPRPTLGAVCSWLFAQAQPYAVKPTSEVTVDSTSNSTLLGDIEAKGWL